MRGAARIRSAAAAGANRLVTGAPGLLEEAIEHGLVTYERDEQTGAVTSFRLHPTVMYFAAAELERAIEAKHHVTRRTVGKVARLGVARAAEDAAGREQLAPGCWP